MTMASNVLILFIRSEHCCFSYLVSIPCLISLAYSLFTFVFPFFFPFSLTFHYSPRSPLFIGLGSLRLFLYMIRISKDTFMTKPLGVG